MFTNSKLSLVDMMCETALRPCFQLHIVVHLPVQQMSEEQSYCKSVAKKQQQQAQLSKLPRHHPLIREPHSDEGCFLFHFKQLIYFVFIIRIIVIVTNILLI